VCGSCDGGVSGLGNDRTRGSVVVSIES